MKNLGDMMKQVQAMQSRMAEMQAKLEQALAVDPSLLKPEEKDILEDLIIAAHTDAKNKSEAMMAEEMKSVTGGLPLPPGFKLPF